MILSNRGGIRSMVAPDRPRTCALLGAAGCSGDAVVRDALDAFPAFRRVSTGHPGVAANPRRAVLYGATTRLGGLDWCPARLLRKAPRSRCCGAASPATVRSTSS